MFIKIQNRLIRVEKINTVSTEFVKHCEYGSGDDIIDYDIDKMEEAYRYYCYKNSDNDELDNTLPLINWNTLKKDKNLPDHFKKAVLFNKYNLYINETQCILSTSNFPLFLEEYIKLERALTLDLLED